MGGSPAPAPTPFQVCLLNISQIHHRHFLCGNLVCHHLCLECSIYPNTLSTRPLWNPHSSEHLPVLLKTIKIYNVMCKFCAKALITQARALSNLEPSSDGEE